MLLSAARSELFNRVLAERVQAGSWERGLDGEVWMLDGSRSVFGPEPLTPALEARAAALDIHPTAPLWGRGNLRTSDDALAVETRAVGGEDAQALRAGLEAAGLKQERRATRLLAGAMAGEWLDPTSLRLRFELPPGSYATVVLSEFGRIQDRSSESGFGL